MELYRQIICEINFKLPDNINPITEENLEKLSQQTEVFKTNISDLKQQTFDLISQYKQDINNITNQTAESFTKNLTQTTNNLTNQIVSVTEKSQNSLNETIEKAQTLTNDLNEKITVSLDGILDSWIQEHLLLNWLVTHPIFAIIIILFSLVLIFSLGQVFLDFIKHSLIAILRTPWLLSKFVFLKSVNQPLENNYSNSPNNNHILQKLEAIERNQQAILQQLSNFNQK